MPVCLLSMTFSGVIRKKKRMKNTYPTSNWNWFKVRRVARCDSVKASGTVMVLKYFHHSVIQIVPENEI